MARSNDSERYELSDSEKRDLELTSAPHTYARPGRHTAAVKIIDIFGNDTMTLVPVTV